jgi:ribosomal protein S12 methylthiotransferase
MDLVIINTCGFIKDAKEESLDMILEHVEAKRKGLIGKLMVMGCLSQRYKDELTKEIPEVDYWFGVHDYNKILALLGVDVPSSKKRWISTIPHYSYLKISEGCNRRCSFCAIPNIRGNAVSIRQKNLLNESESLAKKGVKELILIAQDLTNYGIDINNKRHLATLIKEIDDRKLFTWIRLLYAYPDSFPMEVIHLMAERESICNYLDIPLQHINDKVLKAMKRGRSSFQTRKLLEDIRKIVPDIALRTTILVGFPGETDADFKELLDFVKESRFDRLGAFTYSPEEGTAAYKMKDNVPNEIKQERLDRLMEIQEQISYQKNANKISKEFKILIDRKEGDNWIGRSEYDAPEVDNEIIIESKKPLEIGSFQNVIITDAVEFDLYGKIIE